MSLLTTIAQEPRVIASALFKGEVQLPSNYWRIRLCCFFFWKDDKEDLFRILQNNFCPLFWTSNFILVSSFIWLPVYLVIHTISYILDRLTNWRIQRQSSSITKQKQKQEELATWNLAKPNVDWLRAGKETFDIHRPRYEDLGLLGLYPQWDQMKQFAFNGYERYYCDFRAKHPYDADALYSRLVHQLEKEEETQRERNRIAEERAAQWKQRREVLFGKIFAKGKVIFQSTIVFASLAAAFYVGLGLLWLVVNAIVPALSGIVGFFFVSHPGVLPMVVLAVGVGVFIYLQLKEDSYTRTQLTPEVAEFFEGVASGFSKAWSFVSPVFKAAGAVFSFCYDFVRMFFSNNCPGITYKDD